MMTILPRLPGFKDLMVYYNRDIVKLVKFEYPTVSVFEGDPLSQFSTSYDAARPMWRFVLGSAFLTDL